MVEISRLINACMQVCKYVDLHYVCIQKYLRGFLSVSNGVVVDGPSLGKEKSFRTGSSERRLMNNDPVTS